MKNISIENIPEEFENMYNNLSKNSNIQMLEAKKKKAQGSLIVLIITFIITMILMSKGNTMTFIACIILMAIIWYFGNNVMKFQKEYKKEIVPSVIKLVSEKLKYIPDNVEHFGMKEEYRRANFDNEYYNRFYQDDYIEGFLDEENHIKMCDLHIQHHTSNGKHSHTYEVFQGLFLITECNKNIGTNIKISRNEMKIFDANNRVEMDSQEFEKYFDIYSENKILAMQLLTSDIMSVLIEFYKKYNIEYEIVIRNNKIYMRFATGSMFEANILGNVLDKQVLFKYYSILILVEDITKKINEVLKEIEI